MNGWPSITPLSHTSTRPLLAALKMRPSGANATAVGSVVGPRTVSDVKPGCANVSGEACSGPATSNAATANAQVIRDVNVLDDKAPFSQLAPCGPERDASYLFGATR